MTAKQQALKDIQEDLQKENKSFCGFILRLNPIMQNLVHEQLIDQAKKNRENNPRKRITRPMHSTHIATCFLINGNTQLKRYNL